MSPRMENRASRTRSAVGRVRLPRGLTSRRPLWAPATTLIPAGGGRGRALRRSMARGLRRDRVELGAEALQHGVAEKPVLRLLEPGVPLEQLVRPSAGTLQQLRVLGQARDPELRQSVLAGPEDLPRPAQLEIDLGQPEAVRLARDRLQPRQAGIAEQ